MRDFLHPIMPHMQVSGTIFNRDEYILVPFSNILINMNEVLFYTILALRDIEPLYDKYYPHIEKIGLLELSREDLYVDLLRCSELELLPCLFTNGKLDPSKIDIADFINDYLTLLAYYDLRYGHYTQMQIIVDKLLREEFVKRIYITDSVFDTPKIEYLSTEYPTFVNKKLVAASDTVLEALQEFPEITTVFIETVDELDWIFNHIDTELLKGKMFYVSIGQIDYEVRSKFVFTRPEPRIENAFEKYGCYVEYFSPLCIPDRN